MIVYVDVEKAIHTGIMFYEGRLNEEDDDRIPRWAMMANECSTCRRYLRDMMGNDYHEPTMLKHMADTLLVISGDLEATGWRVAAAHAEQASLKLSGILMALEADARRVG